jgi:hypothetical protein
MRTRYELKQECEKVNRLLLADAKRQGLGTKSSQARLNEARKNDSTSFSRWLRLEIREYIRRALERHDTINPPHAINNCAYLFKISQAATERHVKALCCDHGPFTWFGEVIMINPNYSEADDYWTDAPSDQVESEDA